VDGPFFARFAAAAFNNGFDSSAFLFPVVGNIDEYAISINGVDDETTVMKKGVP